MIFNYEDLYRSGSSPYQRNPIYGSQEGPQAFDNEGGVEEPNKARDLGQKLVNGVKIGLIFVGIFGGSNVLAKFLSREKISKKDILWTLVPELWPVPFTLCRIQAQLIQFLRLFLYNFRTIR